MKIFTITIAFCILSLTAVAQDFAGYRSGHNTGVNGVFFNPANIADSRYRWDFTLFNVSTALGNNKASFKLKDIGKTLDGDSIKNIVFSNNAGPTSGMVSVAVTGPSVFFNLNKKSAIALTTRARVMSNIIDVDGKLANQLTDANANNVGLPYSFASTTNMIVNANGWTEFGASYAREIMHKGVHYLKGGLSLKYLAGAANVSVNINALRGTIADDVVRNDGYLTNASGAIGLNFGGINLSNVEASDAFAFKSTGFGADLGLVYEYRPDTSDAVRDAAGELRRDMNKYMFRVGLALLDAGSISYQRDVNRSGGYRVNIAANQRFYLNALANAKLDNFKDTLNKYPQFFTPDGNASTGSYKVSLPTTLQLDVDYHLHKGFYVNLATQLALSKSQSNVNNSQYYNAVSLTPRLESRAIGIYIPLTYSALTEFTGGASVRLGPLFFGSGSILSAALGSSKQADFFIGFHFGGLQTKYKQPKNVSKQ